MEIRVGRTADIDGCFSLQLQTYELYWKKEDFERMIDDKYAKMIVAVDPDIVGYCVGFITPTKQDEAILHESRVDVNRRHTGIGTALVNAFCESLAEEGIKAIFADISDEHRPFYVDSCKFAVAEEQWTLIEKYFEA